MSRATERNLAVNTSTPQLRAASSLRRRVIGWFHARVLIPVSKWYCRWTGEMSLAHEGVFMLPFNMVLKRGPRTCEDEGLAMDFAHSMGLPAPKFLGYGEYRQPSPFPGCLVRPWGSILMTRLPGKPLNEVEQSLSSSDIDNIKLELSAYMSIMRERTSPYGPRVCSISGGPVHGPRLPSGTVGPCDDEAAFVDTFLYFSDHYREQHASRPDDAIRVIAEGASMTDVLHPTVFTHADLLAHNILVQDGHITGIIDWETLDGTADYWEYIQMLRVSVMHLWWPRLVVSLPGYHYERELKAGIALWELAQDSFSW